MCGPSAGLPHGPAAPARPRLARPLLLQRLRPFEPRRSAGSDWPFPSRDGGATGPLPASDPTPYLHRCRRAHFLATRGAARRHAASTPGFPIDPALPVGYGRWERGARIDSVVPHHFAEVNFGMTARRSARLVPSAYVRPAKGLDGDSVGAATGRHGGLGDGRPDERPPLGEGESVPVAGRNGDGRSRGPD